MKRRRFTQGELVIVLLIVGLLIMVIAVSGPHHWDSRQEKGRGFRVACTAHLKMLGAASALYAADHGGVFPGPTPSPGIPTWDAALAQQMGFAGSPASWGKTAVPPKEATGFVCGIDAAAWDLTGTRFTVTRDLNKRDWPVWGFVHEYRLKDPQRRSYALNLGAGEVAPVASGIPASSIVTEAGTVQLCELHDAGNLLGDPRLAGQTKDEFLAKIFDAKTTPYHGTKMAPSVNVLMYDGHVEVLGDAAARADGGKMFEYRK